MYIVRRGPTARAWILAVAAALVMPTAGSATHADPIPAVIPLGDVTVGLQVIADGLTAPVWGTFAPGNDKRLFVMDQIGKVWSIDVSNEGSRRGRKKLFLDLGSRLVRLPAIAFLGYDERGALGLAFHPDFERNGLFYTFTSEPTSGPADFSTLPAGTAPDHQNVVAEWRAVRDDDGDDNGDDNGDDDGDDDDFVVDPASRRELLRVDHPQFNHDGGALAFGPDRMLYVSIGDGGAADDQGPGHAPEGNGQSLADGNVLGKILRIDPTGTNASNGKYGVPGDNPFVGRAGADEIFARGFRNPYRMSFDRETGDLIVGDVGQNDIEEIDVVTWGGNYGWPVKEGTFRFNNNGSGPGFTEDDSPGFPADLIDPVAQYDHFKAGTDPQRPEGIAIVGGFKYRGRRVRELRDRYVFGDYSQAFAQGLGRVFYLDDDNAIKELRFAGRDRLGLAVFGFAEDGKGELYVLGNAQGTITVPTFDRTNPNPGPLVTSGVVLKITRARGR